MKMNIPVGALRTARPTFLICAVLMLAGCARLRVVQDETSPDGTVRHTELNARTIWDAKSELAKARTTMTDKTQGVSVSGLNQESSSTGVVQVLKIVVETAAPIAKAAAGIP